MNAVSREIVNEVAIVVKIEIQTRNVAIIAL